MPFLLHPFLPQQLNKNLGRSHNSTELRIHSTESHDYTFYWVQIQQSKNHDLKLQTGQINMAMFVLYLIKSDASVRYCILAKSRFTRYQKHTAIYNWSPYMKIHIKTILKYISECYSLLTQMPNFFESLWKNQTQGGSNLRFVYLAHCSTTELPVKLYFWMFPEAFSS